MGGFLIGMAVTVVAAWMILKKYQPHAVLLLSGLLMLALTAILFPETSILFKKAKSSGWVGFDVFGYVKDSTSFLVSGIGLVIMSAGGFAKYMDHIGATDAMVRVSIAPLKALKAPYAVLAAGYAVGQVLNIFIPSAAGLAMLLLVTFFPTLIRLGVSRAAAAAMIATTAVLDLGPASAAAVLASRTAHLDPAIYFVKHQIPVSVVTILVISILTYVSGRYFDARDGHVADPLASGPAAPEAAGESGAPLAYALLPALPLVMILVFSKLVVAKISLHVVTAMLIGTLLGMACEAVRTRDLRTTFRGLMAFFNGMGSMFGPIIMLLVCSAVFSAGLQAIGAIGYMIHSAQTMGFGPGTMTVVMCTLVAATAIITGSGNAAFFAFSGLVPEIAGRFGASVVAMVMPMQLTAGMARSLSPVAGVVIAVCEAGRCSPMEIVRRTALPVGGGLLAMVAYCVLFA